MIKFKSNSANITVALGECLGSLLEGGEVIECQSDLGGGKTTLVTGIAKGFGALDPVSSPSFTICNTYQRDDSKQLQHFDFYRLSEPGIMRNELSEVIGDPDCVTVVEWGDSVEDILPQDRIKIKIVSVSENEREISFNILDGKLSSGLEKRIEDLKQ